MRKELIKAMPRLISISKNNKSTITILLFKLNNKYKDKSTNEKREINSNEDRLINYLRLSGWYY